jgi:O-antigen ligase
LSENLIDTRVNKFQQNINNIALILFVFGVNFEYWDPFGLQGIFSISKMTAIIYIASWVPNLKTIDLRSLKYFLIPLIIYLLVEFFSSALNTVYAEGVLDTFNFKLFQLLLLVVLIVSHIINQPKAINWILNAFITSVLFLSILSLMGVGVALDPTASNGRLTMFGENPNMIGMKAAFVANILFYYIINARSNLYRLFYLGLLIPIIVMLIAAASRGAFLSIFLGVAIMSLSQKTSGVKKIVLLFVMGFASFLFFNYVMESNQKFKTRMELFMDEGETGRNEIWYAAFNIIEDNFIIGVGKPAALPVMQEYLGKAMDPHNVFLYVLITSGTIGFFFFMMFIYRLGKSLYLSFRIDKNPLFLVLYFILLFNMAKAGGFINKTFLWFFFAILIGISIKLNSQDKKLI